MKAIFTTLLVCSFLGIAVLGVFAINHIGADGHTGCFALAAQGADCPKKEAVPAFLDFHLDILKSFSNAIFGETVVLTLLLLLAAFGMRISQNLKFNSSLFAFQTASQASESFSFPWQRKFIHWLQLQEHSPDIA
ncbi:MAG: hypothetical protein HYS60_02820 [Candidatus Wildermuthbacteria bacterium]|nr:hypothetical protein [Candidatus Wildermuthbacteria bacterium]